MRIKRLIVVFTVLNCFTIGNFAQESESIDASTPGGLYEKRIREKDERISRQINGRRLSGDHSIIAPGRVTRSIRVSKRDRKMVETHRDDRLKYAKFLKQRGTGLVRLFDAGVCGDERKPIISASIDCPYTVHGYATSFSFQTKKYTIRKRSNIHYSANRIVGEVFAHRLLYGGSEVKLTMLTKIEGTSLDGISIDSTQIRNLLEYNPGSTFADVQEKSQELLAGITLGSTVYRNSVEIERGATFVLRSIDYNDYFSPVRNNRSYLQGRGKDIVVAFEIVREHSDGSISVLWKKLKQSKVRKLRKLKRGISNA